MKKLGLLVDAQNDFITGALANPAAQAKVSNIAFAHIIEERLNRDLLRRL